MAMIPTTVSELTTPARVYAYLDSLERGPIRSLGQNFLLDSQLIASLCHGLEIQPNQLVLEIGPGLGHFTRQLLEQGAAVLAVEKDQLLAEGLPGRLGEPPQLEVIGQDVLELSRAEVESRCTARCADGSSGFLVTGNLPYYISSEIMTQLFEDWYGLWSKAGFILQEEVVDRLIAKAGSKAYGRLSILVQTYATVRKVRTLAAQFFVPRPGVTSAWCLLSPCAVEYSFTPSQLGVMTGHCFAQRRKTLANNLSRAYNRTVATELLEQCGLDGSQRAESLSVPEFIGLAEAATNSHLL